MRHSPSGRSSELTPSRLGPNSNLRGGAGGNSPSQAPGTSLPSFENLSSGLPESEDGKRRRVQYNDQEQEVSSEKRREISSANFSLTLCHLLIPGRSSILLRARR